MFTVKRKGLSIAQKIMPFLSRNNAHTVTVYNEHDQIIGVVQPSHLWHRGSGRQIVAHEEMRRVAAG